MSNDRCRGGLCQRQMDTVTLVRSAIRGLLKAADRDLQGELRAVLVRDDDYAAAGKPVCDYDDPAARARLPQGSRPTGGIWVAGSKAARWRAKPRTTRSRAAHQDPSAS